MLRIALSLFPARLKGEKAVNFYKAKNISVSTSKRLFHAVPVFVNHTKMMVHILPTLQDNFMYLIVDEDTQETAVVDPVSPDQVICALKENRCRLTKVLTTHHHWDHAGGNESLNCAVPGLHIFGGDDRVGALTCKVSHGSVITLGKIKIECLHTPCHTKGHISYYVTRENAEPAVFTGDTLFIGGCGKFFEGTAEQMHYSLNGILGSLPENTKVYCGHEYTVNNLKFGLHVEPRNRAIKEKLDWAYCRRKNNLPTVPSTIGEEKLINPFMRVCEPGVTEHTQLRDPIQVMAALRSEKDCFKNI